MSKIIFQYLILAFHLAVLSACKGTSLAQPQTNTQTPVVSDESSFCSTQITYDPGVLVSGTAKFLRRGLNLQIQSGIVTSATTGAVISTALPIKHAEVKITQNGTLIQCGTTNSLGELKALNGTSSLFLPNDAGTFTVEVFARSNYTFPTTGKPASATINASVKEDIYSNTVYKISGTLNSNGFGGGANSPINLVAQASESASSKIEGGAFNIYNNWVTTFEYLISTSNTSNLDVSCLSNRLDIYWKAGFNPATYIDPDATGTLSFYLRDYNELYICGGSQGNVSTADTDHFDDAVILHEIGHHIENVCSRMDSPGGQHFAQYRIDPRLAWSEAWGNFMGAHIIKNNTAKINPNLTSALPNGEWLHYSDTKGYIEGTPTFNGSMILMRLNKPGNGTELGTIYDIANPVTYPGESHTREGSIARGLFKGVNTCNNCGGGITFDKYWRALGTSSAGIGYITSPFSSSAKFFAKVYSANSNSFSASMTTILTNDESLHMIGSAPGAASYQVSANTSSTGIVTGNAWPGYASKLTTSSTCSGTPMVLQPRRPNTSCSGISCTYATASDQRYTNHFYAFSKADLTGVTSIRMVPDSSCPVDLDVIVFNSDYTYNEDCLAYNSTPVCTSVAKTTNSDVVVYSRNAGSGTTLTTESINLSSLGNSYYLLNVRGYADSPNSIPTNASCVYRLKDQNGSVLCPSTSY